MSFIDQSHISSFIVLRDDLLILSEDCENLEQKLQKEGISGRGFDELNKCL